MEGNKAEIMENIEPISVDLWIQENTIEEWKRLFMKLPISFGDSHIYDLIRDHVDSISPSLAHQWRLDAPSMFGEISWNPWKELSIEIQSLQEFLHQHTSHDEENVPPKSGNDDCCYFEWMFHMMQLFGHCESCLDESNKDRLFGCVCCCHIISLGGAFGGTPMKPNIDRLISELEQEGCQFGHLRNCKCDCDIRLFLSSYKFIQTFPCLFLVMSYMNKNLIRLMYFHRTTIMLEDAINKSIAIDVDHKYLLMSLYVILNRNYDEDILSFVLKKCIQCNLIIETITLILECGRAISDKKKLLLDIMEISDIKNILLCLSCLFYRTPGDLELVELVINIGADINYCITASEKDRLTNCIFDYCVYEGEYSRGPNKWILIPHMLHIVPMFIGESVGTLPILSYMFKDTILCEYLIKNGANKDQALRSATIFNNRDYSDCLIKNGANITYNNDTICTGTIPRKSADYYIFYTIIQDIVYVYRMGMDITQLEYLERVISMKTFEESLEFAEVDFLGVLLKNKIGESRIRKLLRYAIYHENDPDLPLVRGLLNMGAHLIGKPLVRCDGCSPDYIKTKIISKARRIFYSNGAESDTPTTDTDEDINMEYAYYDDYSEW